MRPFVKLLSSLFLLLAIVGAWADSEPFGTQAAFAGETLTLNGTGVRSKAFFKLYTAGLYLRSKSTAADDIVKADEPMAMRLLITSSMITSEKMEAAIREGFAKSTGSNVAPLQSQIDRFIAVFKPEVAEGDVYDMVYVPGKGTLVSKGGQAVVTLEGLAFKQALFGIWLGERPVQQDLKEGLLGGSK